MGVDVTYNSIPMLNVLMDTPFSETIVRDPSNTDQLRSEYLVSFEAVLHLGNWNRSILGEEIPIGVESLAGLPSGSSADIYNQIKGALRTDRQAFDLTIDGVSILYADATTDVANGPKVLGCDVTHMPGMMLRIRWKGLISVVKCDLGGANTEWPVINNRWSVADEIDQTNKTTRTWNGQLTLSHLPAFRSPHIFRHLCAPALFPGFRRSRMQFLGEPSGLVLNYTIIDEQLSCESAPYPATDYRVYHNKKWNTTGAKQIETIQVELEGATLVNRSFLASRAAQILYSRGRINAAEGFAKRIIREMNLTESFAPGGSSVSASMIIESVVQQPGSLFTMGLIDAAPFGEILTLPQPVNPADPNYYNPNVSWLNVGPWGTGMGLLVATLAAAWQTPCTTGHANIQGGPTPNSPGYQTTTQEAPVVTWQQGTPSSIDPPSVNQPSQDYPYHFARVESELDTNGGYVGLPLATTPASGPSTIPIKLHASTTIRTIRVNSERVGDWPKVMRFVQFTDSQGVVHSPMKRRFITQAREKLGDGKDLYSLSYEMTFTLDREYTDEQPIPVGVLPWDSQTPFDTRIPASAFIPPDDNLKGIA